MIGVNTPVNFRIGTWQADAGVEAKIAPDGEILTRGPHVMKGYFNKPDATAEAIDGEGWFHTGDIGVIDDGFIRITDRKKDIIVTAGGKNIAPQPIENMVKTNKYASQAVMIGDRRKFPILLVVPNYDTLEKWAKLRNIIWTDDRSCWPCRRSTRRGPGGSLQADRAGALRDAKKIALLGTDFTVEGEELTPTLKVKRRVIEKNYKSLIDSCVRRHGSGAVSIRELPESIRAPVTRGPDGILLPLYARSVNHRSGPARRSPSLKLRAW